MNKLVDHTTIPECEHLKDRHLTRAVGDRVRDLAIGAGVDQQCGECIVGPQTRADARTARGLRAQVSMRNIDPDAQGGQSHTDDRGVNKNRVD